jgi:hypothetical protein
MTIDLLSVHGGPFDIARIIDLGETRFVGRVPEVEDQWFDATATRHVGNMPDQEFWSLLEKSSHEKLEAIFGPDLKRIGTTCVVEETYGLRSLGCYWASSGRLTIEEYGDRPRVRFTWHSVDGDFKVPVTDIRLYGADHVMPCEATIHRLGEQLAAEPRVLVSVGLSRPYRKKASDPPRHWLQINNFHLRENPCWSLQIC